MSLFGNGLQDMDFRPELGGVPVPGINEFKRHRAAFDGPRFPDLGEGSDSQACLQAEAADGFRTEFKHSSDSWNRGPSGPRGGGLRPMRLVPAPQLLPNT